MDDDDTPIRGWLPRPLTSPAPQPGGAGRQPGGASSKPSKVNAGATVQFTSVHAPSVSAVCQQAGGTTTCGAELTRELRGIVHPVLPCGARIVVAFGGREAETEVIDQGPVGAGEEFSLTAPLAAELGVDGLQTVRWRFSTGTG